jgi:ligand-binding SRPBCC domain-containing protein
MKTFLLKSEQWIAKPIEEVFAFFSEPRNLQAITPPWLDFEILNPDGIVMAEGTHIDYRLRLHGIPLRWRTRIAAWQPPVRFVDEQIRGPYRLWVHEHTFEPHEGGTKVRDRVEYAVAGGALIRRIFVAGDIERIFAYRRNALARIFGPTPV